MMSLVIVSYVMNCKRMVHCTVYIVPAYMYCVYIALYTIWYKLKKRNVHTATVKQRIFWCFFFKEFKELKRIQEV